MKNWRGLFSTSLLQTREPYPSAMALPASVIVAQDTRFDEHRPRVRTRRMSSKMKVDLLLLAMTAILGAAVSSPSASAQVRKYEAPRTSDGRPDLEGYWTNTSMTTLERNSRFKELTLSKEAAAQIEAARRVALANQNLPTSPDAPPPTIGQGVIGYNTFWLDGGDTFGVVRGEVRSSWIVDPPDGRIPYSESGKALFERAMVGQEVVADGPESRTVGERCLIGFGSTGGPPMLNVGYNNRYQIIQTVDHIVVLVEMNHDARIIPVGGNEPGLTKWLGESAGYWDGDTFVVETTNFRDEEALRFYRGASFYVSKSARVVERFMRWSETEILYEFEVHDPDIVTRPWRAEMVLRRSADPVFEYACHEGNHAMPGILAGARRGERTRQTGQGN